MLTLEQRSEVSPQARMRDWFVYQYYLPRIGLEAFVAREPIVLAKALAGEVPSPGAERKALGVVSEVLSCRFLNHFSPGYTVSLAPVELDQSGIDLLVTPDDASEPIGGMDITIARNKIWQKVDSKCDAPLGCAVVQVDRNWMGLKTVIESIHEGTDVKPGEFVKEQIRSGAGVAGAEYMLRSLDEAHNKRFSDDFSFYLRVLKAQMEEYCNLPCT